MTNFSPCLQPRNNSARRNRRDSREVAVTHQVNRMATPLDIETNDSLSCAAKKKEELSDFVRHRGISLSCEEFHELQLKLSNRGWSRAESSEDDPNNKTTLHFRCAPARGAAWPNSRPSWWRGRRGGGLSSASAAWAGAAWQRFFLNNPVLSLGATESGRKSKQLYIYLCVIIPKNRLLEISPNI